MYKNPYLILQTYESATESEIDFAYERLKKQYSEDRFLPGDAGADAARKLNELEEAYREIKQKFAHIRAEQKFGSKYGEIENIIKQNKINEAQQMLDEITDRNAEWHYLQSIVFYKKNWYNESKNQLEMAISMDPTNSKYKDALNRLNVFLNGSTSNPHEKAYRQADEQIGPDDGSNRNNRQDSQYGGNQYNQYGRSGYNENRNMGMCGSGAPENCCLQLLCADCCCECMGGDLITCC
jgi:molecular chaperone DnaJ